MTGEPVWHIHNLTYLESDDDLDTKVSHCHPVSEPNHQHEVLVGPAWAEES